MKKDQSNNQKLYVSWQEINVFCKKVTKELKKINFTPDLIITPLRGGAIPAVIISHMTGISNLITVMASRTKDDSIESERKEIILGKLPTSTEVENKNILIVDEIADSGDTLDRLYYQISNLKPQKIITSVMFTNSKRFKKVNRKPDISTNNTTQWIVFPWE